MVCFLQLPPVPERPSEVNVPFVQGHFITVALSYPICMLGMCLHCSVWNGRLTAAGLRNNKTLSVWAGFPVSVCPMSVCKFSKLVRSLLGVMVLPQGPGNFQKWSWDAQLLLCFPCRFKAPTAITCSIPLICSKQGALHQFPNPWRRESRGSWRARGLCQKSLLSASSLCFLLAQISKPDQTCS